MIFRQQIINEAIRNQRIRMSKMDANIVEFRQRCVEICNGGFTSLIISIGHHLKLFDQLPVQPEAAKSGKEIAAAADCKERYILEWLRAMVCANIVNCNATGDAFWLPKWRKQLLSSDSPEGLIPMINMVSLLAPVFEKIAACFRPSGPRGTSYSDYKKFHEYLSEVTDKAHHSGLLDQFIPSIDGLQTNLESGINVIDIGCGHGTPSIMLAQAFPKSNFYGIDIYRPAIEFAIDKKERLNLNNVNFSVLCAATGMPPEWTERFDYVTAFDAIHDQAFPSRVLKEIYRILKHGGLFSMVDIKGESGLNTDKEAPMAATWYTVSLFHCMPVSLNTENGEGLGNMWGRVVASRMLSEAGFQLIFVQEMHYNPSNYHYLCQKA